MDKTAVIAEYNPFHNGHAIQIEYIRKNFPDTCIIAVMSGNIVQRGELAVLEKYTRAAAALKTGVDAVLELPYPWCASSAGYFARAAISIVGGLGIDRVCFGSESGSIEELSLCSCRICSSEFRERFSEAESEGKNSSLSYIQIMRSLYEKMYGERIPNGANNTLAIEYLNALYEQKSSVLPVTYKRLPGFSASVAREYYRSNDGMLKNVVPEALYELYASNRAADYSLLSPIILWHFRSCRAEDISGCADMGDGMAKRLINAAREAGDINEFYSLAASKKYTYSRLRRTVFNCLLNTTEQDLKRKPAYTLLLAANSRGCAALREMKREGTVAVITKPSDYRSAGALAKRQFEFSLQADELYATAAGRSCDELLKKSPLILKS